MILNLTCDFSHVRFYISFPLNINSCVYLKLIKLPDEKRYILCVGT